MSKMSLNHVAEGQTVRVDELLATGSIRRRLLDIGLVEGTNVSCLQKSPAGDPVAYLIRGAVIAIRRMGDGINSRFHRPGRGGQGAIHPAGGRR